MTDTPSHNDPTDLYPSQSRAHYFHKSSAAFKHGIIGIEYNPEAHLPLKHQLSWIGHRLTGQHHAGPITTLLVDDTKLHEWMAPAYGEGFSRVRLDKHGRVVGPNFGYHSRPFNTLFDALKAAYEALPGLSNDKKILSVFKPAVDQDAGSDRKFGAYSCIAMRLGRPDHLLSVLHELPLPTGEPLIDAQDVNIAMNDLKPSFADRVDYDRRQREARGQNRG